MYARCTRFGRSLCHPRVGSRLALRFLLHHGLSYFSTLNHQPLHFIWNLPRICILIRLWVAKSRKQVGSYNRLHLHSLVLYNPGWNRDLLKGSRWTSPVKGHGNMLAATGMSSFMASFSYQLPLFNWIRWLCPLCKLICGAAETFEGGSVQLSTHLGRLRARQRLQPLCITLVRKFGCSQMLFPFRWTPRSWLYVSVDPLRWTGCSSSCSRPSRVSFHVSQSQFWSLQVSCFIMRRYPCSCRTNYLRQRFNTF